MTIFKLIIALFVGYFFGSINTAMLVGNIYGVDLRKKGSGNAGLTNTYRILGGSAAALVLVGDILKAMLSCFIGFLLTRNELGPEHFFDLNDANLGMMLAGTSCIIGHICPMFFQFKGGKGVLTSATVIFLMDYRIGAIALCIFIVIVLLSKYVSLGSILAAICFPIVSIIFKKPTHFMVYSIVIAILIVFMHRKNIGRLINGTESKLRFKR